MFELYDKVWGYRTLNPHDGWFISLCNDNGDRWVRLTLDVPETPGVHYSASDHEMIEMMLENLDDLLTWSLEQKELFEYDREQILKLTPSDFK